MHRAGRWSYRPPRHCCSALGLLFSGWTMATHLTTYCRICCKPMCCLAQVVITDVDECLEALHENVSANLPSYCTLAASCLCQGQMAAAPLPCPASSPAVATIPLESEKTGPANSSSRDHTAHDTSDVQEPNAAVGGQNLGSSNDAIEQQDTRSQSARCHTEVLVAELDWGRDASNVAPPFDVILIADVVSKSIFTCKALCAICIIVRVKLAQSSKTCLVLLPHSCIRCSECPNLEIASCSNYCCFLSKNTHTHTSLCLFVYTVL